MASTTASSYCSIVYDSNADRVVIFYRDSNDGNKCKAVVGTCASTGITSLGTPINCSSGQAVSYMGTAFDSNANRVVVHFASNNTNYSCVGTVDPSDNSISFGTGGNGTIQQVDQVNSQDAIYTNVVFSTAGNRVVFAFRRNAGDYKQYFRSGVINPSTNLIAFDTQLDPSFGNLAGGVAMSYNTTHQGILLAYRDSTNNNYGTANILKYDAGSATKLGLGNDTIFQSEAVSGISVESETRYGRSLIQYERDSNGYGEARGVLLDVPNLTLSLGGSGYYYTGSGEPQGLRYLPDGDVFALFHRDGSNKLFYVYWKFTEGGSVNDFKELSLATANAASEQFTDYRWFNHYDAALMPRGEGSIYNPIQKKTYCLIDNTAAVLYGQILDTSRTNLKIIRTDTVSTIGDNFIGFSKGAYTNGQTATMQNVGVLDNQSSLIPKNLLFKKKW